MAELKTKPTKKSAESFLKTITPKQKKDDALILLKLFEEITKEKPVMWGSAIIGFGRYEYARKNEKVMREWMKVGFSPRKQNLVVYILSGLNEETELLSQLGKYKTGSSCLYLNNLADIDMKILKKLIKKGYNKKVFVGQC